MLVNQSTVDAIFTNFKATFNMALGAAPSQYSSTCMTVPSNGLRNEYDWTDMFPKMREWAGDKYVKNLKANGYTISNKEYETTIGVERRHIETDNLGIYEPQVKNAAFAARQLPDELTADLKNASFTSTCYDGQYFYDSDHPVGSTTDSNVGSAALSCATAAAAASSYGAGRQAVMEFFDSEGRPLGLVPDTLEVPPALEATARILLESPTLNDLAPNPWRGTAKLIVNPRLTSTTAWFLHVTSLPVRPFVYQERKAPHMVEQTGMDSTPVFMKGQYLFGAEASANAGYGLWQLSYGSTGA